MKLFHVKKEALDSRFAEDVHEVEPFVDPEELLTEEVSTKMKKSGRGRKPKEKELKVIVCRIPAEVHGDFRYICFKEGKTHSELFMDAFAEYLKKHYSNISKTDSL